MRAKCVYENLDFERGQDPKSALDIGILPKLMSEKWEHLKRDLRPYLIDYYWVDEEREVLFLDVEDKMDPAAEVIPIIDGYLEDWAEVEDVITFSPKGGYNFSDDEGYYRYKIVFKPEYVNIFDKIVKEEMPY